MKKILLYFCLVIMAVMYSSCGNDEQLESSINYEDFIQVANRKGEVSKDDKYYIIKDMRETKYVNIFIVDREEDTAKLDELGANIVKFTGVGMKTDYRPSNNVSGDRYYMLMISELSSFE